MPTLADQVREMLRILEVVDPQAAARIKGSATALTPLAEQTYKAPAPPPVRQIVHDEPAAVAKAEQLHTTGHQSTHFSALPEFTPSKLIQGIIWSEILSKPVSKRRQRRM